AAGGVGRGRRRAPDGRPRPHSDTDRGSSVAGRCPGAGPAPGAPPNWRAAPAGTALRCRPTSVPPRHPEAVARAGGCGRHARGAGGRALRPAAPSPRAGATPGRLVGAGARQRRHQLPRWRLGQPRRARLTERGRDARAAAGLAVWRALARRGAEDALHVLLVGRDRVIDDLIDRDTAGGGAVLARPVLVAEVAEQRQ